MTSKQDPKWTDETLPVQKRKQLLAQELARLQQRKPAPRDTAAGDAKPAEKSEKPVASMPGIPGREAHALA